MSDPNLATLLADAPAISLRLLTASAHLEHLTPEPLPPGIGQPARPNAIVLTHDDARLIAAACRDGSMLIESAQLEAAHTARMEALRAQES